MPTEVMPRAGGPSRREFRVTGRFVLISLVLFFVVVASVNALMMTLAIRSFPGADARNGYEVSQGYNKEIANARVQAERGWTAGLDLDRAGSDARLTFSLAGRDGAAITGLLVEARLMHPSDRKQDFVLNLKELAPGRYQAQQAGVARGAWGMALVARSGQGERVYEVHHRAVLKD